MFIDWSDTSLRGDLSHFHHCGRMAIYSIVPKTGVNKTIKLADNNQNRNDELREFASFITQISVAIHIKNIVKADQNRTELSKIVSKNHSDEVRGFQITSTISQLHSKMFMAT